MAVAIVGTPLAVNDGTSYPAEAGSDRVVAISIGIEEFNAVTFAPTYGGVAFVQGALLAGTDKSYLYIGYILEANIPAGSQAFALNPSGLVDATDGVIYTLSGVDQTTVGTGATLDSSPGSATPVLNLTGVADGVAIALYEHENTNTITADAAWTDRLLNAGGAVHRTYCASKTTTAGADTLEPSTGVAVEGVLGSYVFNPVAASGPVITDVNTTETVQVGDTPIVTGTSFLATGGTQSWNGVSVGFSSWADTSITSSAITRGDLAYDTNYDWVVTDNLAVASSPLSVQLAIETGYQFVTLSSPIIALVGGVRTSLCYGAVPDCVTGDQLRVPLLTDQGKAIDISAADGTFVITDAGNTEQTFSFEIWDADGPTGEKWSESTAVVINGVIVSNGLVRPLVSSMVRSLIH